MAELSEVAQFILKERYLIRDEKGEVIETPDEMFHRVAKYIASADVKYNGEDVAETEQKFYDMMNRLDFLPGSPALSNSGKNMGLSSCFVIPVEDDMRKIFEAVTSVACVQKEGGGTGMSFSNLRPKGDIVKSTKGLSSGVISFIRVFDVTTDVVKQAGVRRGASIAILRIDHPDILEFIECKKKEGDFSNFNFSVSITDTFMEALENNEEYELFNPRTMLPCKKLKAKKTWDKIVENTFATGEPGVIFITRINEHNPTPNLGKIDACNPCITGDTLVAVADGRNAVPIKKLVDEKKDVPVYCVNDKNKLVIRYMRHPRLTGEKEKIYRVNLDDGNYVRVNENHKFVLGDGSTKKTSELVKGDSLQIMTKLKRKYDEIIGKEKSESLSSLYYTINFKNRKQTEHRLIYTFYNNMNRIPTGHVIHHKDRNVENNKPENLEMMGRIDHCKLHGEDMLGDENPMRRAKHEWSDEKWRRYREKMSKSTGGNKNARYCGFTNEELREHAIELTRKLGRRFSRKEWTRYAKENSLPQRFSKWRRDHLDGGIYGLSKWAALELNYEHINEDPRLVEHYKNLCKEGYNCYIEDNHIYIKKRCESCGNELITPSESKEVAFCGISCSNVNMWKDEEYKKRTFKKIKATWEIKHKKVREKQANAYNELKLNLSRIPMRKEWMKYCKDIGLTPEISRKSSPFTSYDALQEYAGMLNHRVISVEFDGHEDVYNGTVDEFHNFFVGGFESVDKYGRPKHVFLNNLQCGEIPLLPHESCNLGSINLMNFATEKTIRWKELEECIYTAVHFLDNVIDVNTYPLPEIDEATKKTRKIGLGLMAFHDVLIKQGIRYDSEKAVSFAEKIMRFINEKAFEASCELGKKRGPFPAVKGSVYDKPFSNKPRNATRTSIQPTGTVSQVAGVSSGIEPNFDYEYERLICDKKTNITHWAVNDESISKKLLVKATDIAPQWHVKIQAAFQKYVDNSIAKTALLPYNATKKDVSDAMLLAYKLGCKSITVYRNDSRKKQVMSKRDKCPECGSDVIPQEGCIKCISCGWSKCSI